MQPEARIENELQGVMARRRVILLREGSQLPDPPRGISICQSPLAIHVGWTGSGSLVRTGIRLGTDLTGSVRLAAVPRGSWDAVEHVTDQRGRRVPVACVSHERGVVRLLVNLEDAVQHGNPTWIRNLFREVLERPLQTMLEAKRSVQVGPGVAEAVGGLLRTWPSFSLTGLRREVFLLERLGAEGMPQPMMNRLQLLRKRLEREGKRKPREVLPERVETEIGRLVRLVESRACAWIGFEPGTITGVSNPYAFGADVNQRSIAFRLDMSGSSRLPDLVVWNPMLEIFRRQSCLGEAIKVFHGMEKRGDLYGMVDTLLDYFETNRVGFPVELVGFPDFEF